MRHRRPIHPLSGIALAAILILAAAPPALAKEGIEARLDAPIARETPGGIEVLVGLEVTVLDGSVARPVEGTPFYIRLTGPSGDTTRARTTPDPDIGHYSARVVVPESGIAAIEIGIAGSSDLPVLIVGEPIAAGGISPTTAQAAPAGTAVPVAPPANPVVNVAGAAAAPVAAPAGSAPLPWIAFIGFAAVAAAIFVGAVIVARRLRDGRRPDAPGRTAGG